MKYKAISTEETLPVDLPFLKKQLRITGDDQDIYLRSLIGAATRNRQDFTGRQFVRATLMAYTAYTGRMSYEIERGPVKAITKIEIVQEDNTVLTLAPSDYIVILEELSAFVIIDAYEKLVNVSLTRPDAIQITYTAGWTGEEDSRFPEDVINSVAMMASRMFTNPDDAVDEKCSVSDNLLRAYRCPIV